MVVSRCQFDRMWALRSAGLPIRVITGETGVGSSSFIHLVNKAGGIAPRPRRRRLGQLCLGEREEISRGLAAGQSVRMIAARLNRNPSSICREVNRNGGRSAYRAERAERSAWDRARRPKLCRLASRPALAVLVGAKLEVQWSPEQIAGWLKDTYPEDPELWVSHETIYASLFVQARGVLKKELTAHLRTRRTIRKPKQVSGRTLDKHGPIPDPVSIRERPAAAEDRAVPGHWEGDLLAGAANSYIATLVERRSRFVILIKVRSKTTDEVVGALARRIQHLPDDLIRTLTWDRGAELAEHKQFTIDTGIKVYFCDPQAPWQRGSNENTNGLLRQYFPKGMSLGEVTQNELDRVADRLNTRPRKTLGYKTPAHTLGRSVALIP